LFRKYTQTVLFRDISWVYLAILIISFAEGRQLDESIANNTSVFKVIYEVVSAFGTVGFSMGAGPDGADPYSYSGVLTTTSKATIAVIMMLGRHRGLPSSDDPAVVPSNYASLRNYRARRRRLVMKLKQQQQQQNSKNSSPDASFLSSASDLPHETREDSKSISYLHPVKLTVPVTKTTKATNSDESEKNQSAKPVLSPQSPPSSLLSSPPTSPCPASANTAATSSSSTSNNTYS